MQKHPILTKLCTQLFLFTLVLSSAYAGDFEDENKPGFSGYVLPMIGIGKSKSLGDVSDENKKIDSLDQEAKSETDAIPVFLWQVAFTLKNERTRFHVGTPETNIVEGNFLFETGVSHELEGGTILTAAWIPRIPGLDDEVWKDPYLTGRSREETDRESQGFSLGTEYIFDSPFSLKYSFATQKIEDEQSGLSLSKNPGSKLTVTDLASLRRSGNFHQVEGNVMIPLGDSLMLQPGLNYMRGDTDGAANRFNDFGGTITLMYMQPKYEFHADVSLNSRNYDNSNPVFAKKRDDLEFDTTIGFGYLKPFGFEKAKISILGTYSKRNSSIKFHDSQSMMAGVGISYVF